MESKTDLPLMSIQELKQFDGTGESGKLFVAVCGKVYDVTDKGTDFYKPAGYVILFNCCISF